MLSLIPFAFALIFLFILHQFWWRRRHLPAGPMPLPIIGNIHSYWRLDRWEKKFMEWKKQYGAVYTMWVGIDPFVCINDYKLAAQMFIHDGDAFTDRGSFDAYEKATRGGSFGLLGTSGEKWREQRKFAFRVLREFGLGKNEMQERILDEIRTVFENVDSTIQPQGPTELDFHRHTDIAIGSVINAIMCGYRLTTNERHDDFYKLKRIMNEMMMVFVDPLLQIAVSSDLLRNLKTIRRPFDRAAELYAEIFGHLDAIIDQHEREFSPNAEPRDFIDVFLLEMHRLGGKAGEKFFSRDQLRNILLDIWFAGQESTSGTVTWAIGHLIRTPDAQRKLHEELDRVIGENRLITVADRPNLPYTQAVVMEAQRCTNVAVVNLQRRTTRPISLNGSIIPKGTIVIPQISVFMTDPEHFPDPYAFNPSRFIDESGNVKTIDAWVPFSMGKRQCLGEGMAKMELFLFIANLFNKYRFTPGQVPPSLEREHTGASTGTKPYKCCVERRH